MTNSFEFPELAYIAFLSNPQNASSKNLKTIPDAREKHLENRLSACLCNPSHIPQSKPSPSLKAFRTATAKRVNFYFTPRIDELELHALMQRKISGRWMISA